MKKSILIIALLLISFSLQLANEVEEAPSFCLKSMENKTICLDSLSGSYIILDFWAIPCKSCIQGLDAMKEIFETYKERGLYFLAICEDGPRSIPKVPSFVKGHQWEYTILYDENQEVQNLFGIQAIPETFIIDKQGNIIFRHRGYKEGDEQEIEEILEELLPDEEGDE